MRGSSSGGVQTYGEKLVHDERRLRSAFRQLKGRLHALDAAALSAPSSLAALADGRSQLPHVRQQMQPRRGLAATRARARLRMDATTLSTPWRNFAKQQDGIAGAVGQGAAVHALMSPMRRGLAALWEGLTDLFKRARSAGAVPEAAAPAKRLCIAVLSDSDSDDGDPDDASEADRSDNISDPAVPHEVPSLGLLAAMALGRALGRPDTAAVCEASAQNVVDEDMPVGNSSGSDLDSILYDILPDHFRLPVLFAHMVQTLVLGARTRAAIRRLVDVCIAQRASAHGRDMLDRFLDLGSCSGPAGSPAGAITVDELRWTCEAAAALRITDAWRRRLAEWALDRPQVASDAIVRLAARLDAAYFQEAKNAHNSSESDSPGATIATEIVREARIRLERFQHAKVSDINFYDMQLTLSRIGSWLCSQINGPLAASPAGFGSENPGIAHSDLQNGSLWRRRSMATRRQRLASIVVDLSNILSGFMAIDIHKWIQEVSENHTVDAQIAVLAAALVIEAPGSLSNDHLDWLRCVADLSQHANLKHLVARGLILPANVLVLGDMALHHRHIVFGRDLVSSALSHLVSAGVHAKSNNAHPIRRHGHKSNVRVVIYNDRLRCLDSKASGNSASSAKQSHESSGNDQSDMLRKLESLLVRLQGPDTFKYAPNAPCYRFESMLSDYITATPAKPGILFCSSRKNSSPLNMGRSPSAMAALGQDLRRSKRTMSQNDSASLQRISSMPSLIANTSATDIIDLTSSPSNSTYSSDTEVYAATASDVSDDDIDMDPLTAPSTVERSRRASIERQALKRPAYSQKNYIISDSDDDDLVCSRPTKRQHCDYDTNPVEMDLDASSSDTDTTLSDADDQDHDDTMDDTIDDLIMKSPTIQIKSTTHHASCVSRQSHSRRPARVSTLHASTTKTPIQTDRKDSGAFMGRVSHEDMDELIFLM